MLQRFPHVAYWNLLIGAFFILILFVCLLIMPMLKKDPTDFESFTQACKSNQITYCGLALGFTASAMIFDVIIDCFDRHDSSSGSSLIYSNRIWLGRVFYSIGTLMVGIQFAFQYDYFHIFSASDYYSSFWFAAFCQRILLISTSAFFISISDSTSISSTFPKTALVNILGCAYTISHYVYHQLLDVIRNNNSLFIYFAIPHAAVNYFCLILMSHHSYQIWKTRATWEANNYAHFLYVILFIVTNVLSPSIGTITLIIFGKIDYTLVALIVEFSYAIITVILTVIPGRIARMDAMVSKDRIIATKESYVRYLSHEMRTPMNIMHAGIKLGIDEVSKEAVGCTELDIEEHLDTLIDVKDACETALEILNDFLLYDKLRNGKVELQKKVICVFDFVSKCLKSFTLQLRAKNIKLEFLNHDNYVYTLPSNSCINQPKINNEDIGESKIEIKSSSVNDNESFIHNSNISLISRSTFQNENERFSHIQNNDDMCIDESKLSQVIRNLLSNAIKFTPENGNIQVTMGFMPDAEVAVSSRIHTTGSFDYVTSILRNIKSSCSSLCSRRSIGSDYSLINNTLNSNNQTVDIETGNPLLLNTLSDVSSEETVHGTLRIEVKDSGAGISTENQTRLFKEVVQFDPNVLQAGGGSGMGLFISKDLVDMHDGRISVYSEGVDKGATFRLEIPMCRHTQSIYQSSSVLSLATSSSFNPSVSVNTTSEQLTSDDFILDASITSLSRINSFNNVTQVNVENRTEIIHTDDNKSTTQPVQDHESSLILCEHYLHNDTQGEVTDINALVLSNVTSSSDSTKNIFSPLHNHSKSSIDNEQQGSSKNLKSPTSRLMKSLDTTTNESIQVSVPRKCLVVDDVATSRKMLIKYLKGHYCDQAADGDIAVEMVKAIITSSISAAELPVDSPLRNYDIIFMDYVMPNMKGPVATKAIRDLGYTGLIYGVTGNGLPVDIATFVAAGATDVIIKPFKKEDLLRICLFASSVSEQLTSDDYILDASITSLSRINSFNNVTQVNVENRTEIIHTDDNKSTTQPVQDHESSLILCEQYLRNETQGEVTDINALVLSNVTSSSDSTKNIFSSLHNYSESSIDNEQQGSSKKLKSPTSRLMKSLDTTTIESIQVSVPRKCLVVDDVATSRKMLIKYLKGHYCDQAADGDIAVEMVKAIITSSISAAELPVFSPLRNYDIIFMDYVMPNMKGPVATKAIRDLGYTGLIYGVTGNGLPVDIATFVAAGATDVIIKPFKKEDLLRICLFAPSVAVNTTSEQLTSDAHILDTPITSLSRINSFNNVTQVNVENRTKIIHTDDNKSTTQPVQDHESSLILCEQYLRNETQGEVTDINALVLSNVTSSSDSTKNIFSPLHNHSKSSIDNEQQGSSKKLKSPTSRLMKSLDTTTIESIQVSVPRKCLVVDDVATSRKMLIKYLKGHYCDQAADGDIAVEMVKAIITSSSSAAKITAAELPVDSPLRNYDIIFMDYVMPNMKGPVATKAIRDLGYTGLIYGVTGNGLPVDIATFMAAGATDVIIKPFKKEDLLRICLFAPDSS